MEGYTIWHKNLTEQQVPTFRKKITFIDMIMIIPAVLVDGLEFIFTKETLPFSFYTMGNENMTLKERVVIQRK